jgi:ribosome biogenesis GTPase A
MLKTFLPMGLRMTIRGLQIPNFAFSRRGHNSQMILHSPEQIENMATRKSLKDQGKEVLPRPWKTYAGSDNRKFRVSLVGLPNCGKSSLFNCLVGERIAVVDKLEGMTRDRK